MKDDLKRVIEDFNVTAKINGWNLPITDTIIRHKWPEEKPDKDGQYLTRITAPSGLVNHHLRGYEDGKWGAFENYITHWWDLSEVTE